MTIRALPLALFLLAFPLAAATDEMNPVALDIAACEAAFRMESYPSLEIPIELQRAIARYRGHWRQFCAGGQSPSLSSLFVEAQQIEQAFYDVRSMWSSESREDAADHGEAIHQALSVALPSFIPTFSGWATEYEEFRPLLVDFREASRLGNDEDQHFFRRYTLLHGDTGVAAWIEKETDISGCVRFGGYDWVGALKATAQMRKEIENIVYRGLIDRFESELLRVLAEGSVVRACSNSDAVISDLRAVRNHLSSGDIQVTNAIDKRIRAIEDGRD